MDGWQAPKAVDTQICNWGRSSLLQLWRFMFVHAACPYIMQTLSHEYRGELPANFMCKARWANS